jgi:hypothetical protein
VGLSKGTVHQNRELREITTLGEQWRQTKVTVALKNIFQQQSGWEGRQELHMAERQ